MSAFNDFPEADPELQILARRNVIASFILIFFLLSIPSVLLPLMYSSIMDEFRWSLSDISSFSSWKFLSGALTSLLLGAIFDKIKLKVIVSVGAVMSGLSLVSMMFVELLWVFYIIGFVLGITSVIAAVSCRVLLGRWFSGTLGRVVGVAFTGGSIGGAITAILGEFLIVTTGWQITAAIFGTVIITMVLPLFWILASDHPRNYRKSVEAEHGHRLSGQDVKQDTYFNELIKTRTFWLLMLAHFFVGCVNHTLMEHTPIFIERDLGFSAFIVAGSVSIAMLVSIAGKIGFGWLFDRYSMLGVAACWWLLGVAVLIATVISGPLTVTLFMLLRGAAHGGILVGSPCIALHNFGAASIAKTVSLFSVSSMLGAAFGTTTAGHLHELTGSYQVPFIGLFVLIFLAGSIAALTTPKHWQASTLHPVSRE